MKSLTKQQPDYISIDRETLIKKAVEIGDSLLSEAVHSDGELYWSTLTMDQDRKFSFSFSEQLYSGSAGIALFMLELYKATNDPKYLEAAESNARYLINYTSDHSTINYAFYTGRMGIPYLLIQLYKTTKCSAYLESALQISKDAEVFLNYHINDLINGISGTILGLLHVHSATKDDALLTLIEKFSKQLLRNAFVTREGLSWDRSNSHIKALCGFSHGAAGIGYVFLELGHYFKNEAFYCIAEEAFRYENQLFSTDNNNWPDFRKGAYDEISEQLHDDMYQKGNIEFFSTPGDMSAWCHGAPGIGLSRIRAYELLKKNCYKQDLDNSLKKTIESLKAGIETSFNICHGLGGNSLLFLETYKAFGNKEYLNTVNNTVLNSIKHHEMMGFFVSGYSTADYEDTSLFMGKAGVGYMMLQLSEPLNNTCIIKPDIQEVYNGDTPSKLNPSKQDLIQVLAERYFPNAFKQLNTSEIPLSDSSIYESLLSLFDKKSSNEMTRDAYQYDRAKFDLLNASENGALLRISKKHEVPKAIDSSNSDISQKEIRRPLNVSVVHSQWQWHSDHNEKDDYYTLLISDESNVSEHAMNLFSYVVLNKVDTQFRPVQAIIEDVINEFDLSTEEEMKMIRSNTLHQINELLKSGLLFVK